MTDRSVPAEVVAYMRRAIELAPRGWGQVAPNPLVGAVIERDGQIVGEGWHSRFGAPHAEIEAIRAAGELAKDATLYVTLEPCAHHGKTGPCAEAIIAAGIRKVQNKPSARQSLTSTAIASLATRCCGQSGRSSTGHCRTLWRQPRSSFRSIGQPSLDRCRNVCRVFKRGQKERAAYAALSV